MCSADQKTFYKCVKKKTEGVAESRHHKEDESSQVISHQYTAFVEFFSRLLKNYDGILSVFLLKKKHEKFYHCKHSH